MSQALEFYNEHNAPKTIHRVDHGFELAAPEDPDSWVQGSIVELARVTVPFSTLGRLTRVDTLIQDPSTGQAISDWENPNTFDDVFSFCMGFNQVNDRHYVNQGRRFISYAGSVANWFNIVGCTPLPYLSQWRDNRFAWGNPSNEIDPLPLPDQCAIRLFVHCREDTEYVYRIKGRLVMRWSYKHSAAAQWRAQRC
jgi:hypothetical protein